MSDWKNCRNILCIRPDNMGDLLMSGPAIRALKSSFDARITVLTSSMAAGIAKLIPEIDDLIIFDMPWVKTERADEGAALARTVEILREKKFNAAVIFTVFSQNPLPTAMLAYQAGIPRILAYCRENPYSLITDWVPDEEPYTLVRHQVERDLHLVKTIGAITNDDRLKVNIPPNLHTSVQTKLRDLGWIENRPWLLLHAGVSELKRQYPVDHWVAAGKRLSKMGYQLILTGTAGEQTLTSAICEGIGTHCFDAAGLFGINELVDLVQFAPLLVSVNTGLVHIAAATNTPVVVLYAQTNPQHTPWRVPHRVLEFPAPVEMLSRNEILRHLQRTTYKVPVAMPGPDDILEAVASLSKQSVASVRPSL